MAANEAGGRDNVTVIVVDIDIDSDDDGADETTLPARLCRGRCHLGKDDSWMSMADVSYVPGALTAVAGDQCWALVEASPDSPAVTRIWRQLGQGAAADALLAGLLADGIGGTAGFTLLVAEAGGQHRLFCRGTVGATVVTAPVDGGAPPGEGRATAERINGAGLLTWREQVVDSAGRIFLGEPPADSALRLPATSGVLLAGCMVIDLTNFAARDTVPYAPENSSAPEKPRKKTIVFFPDTITMTHPGSLAGQASPPWPTASACPMTAAPSSRPALRCLSRRAAPPRRFPQRPGPASCPRFWRLSRFPPCRPWPDRAAPQGDPFPRVLADPAAPAVPGPQTSALATTRSMISPGATPPRPWSMPRSGPSGRVTWFLLVLFRLAALPCPEGTPAQAGNRRASSACQYQGAPPTAAQPWPPLPDQAWSGGPRPAAPMAGPVPPPPVPARAPGPPGGGMPPNGMPPGLIDAPPWRRARRPPRPPTGRAGRPGRVPAAPPRRGRARRSGSTIPRRELPERAGGPGPRPHRPDRPALLCPSGHVNPPSSAVCRRCGAPLPQDPVHRAPAGARRAPAVLGDMITWTATCVMGRNPRTDFTGADGEERPHVVKLPSADGDISRTHLRVSLDGWHVLVTDLNSTNGTLVTMPGRDPSSCVPVSRCRFSPAPSSPSPTGSTSATR